MDEMALRALLDGPGVTVERKWDDDLVFMVGGKMFCCLCLADRECGRLSFKVESERFLELLDRPGFLPAPYLARAHWVSVEAPSTLSRGELEGLLRRAFELVRDRLPKRVRRELGID